MKSVSMPSTMHSVLFFRVQTAIHKSAMSDTEGRWIHHQLQFFFFFFLKILIL